MTISPKVALWNARSMGNNVQPFVCQHLQSAVVTERGLGFFQPHTVDLTQWDAYTAWCSNCDQNLLDAGGEWNDEAEQIAQPTLICLGCFRDLYRRHSLSPRQGMPP